MLQKRKKKFNEGIENLLTKRLDQLAPLQRDQVLYTIKGGGKRLRPFLTLVCCGLFGNDEDLAMGYATSLELTHNFTLVHDDISDQDDLRRGKKTLHKKIGVPKALVVGDNMFSLAFQIVAEDENLSQNTKVNLINELSTAMVLISEGQYKDLELTKRYDKFGEKEFLEMVEMKTSQLFEAAACGGGMIGGGSQREISHLREFARTMGISFQIQDDRLDLIGDVGQLGKEIGSDLVEGKTTLIVLHALDNLGEHDSNRLKKIIRAEKNSNDEIKEALELIEGAGSLEYARETAEKYGKKAKQRLEYLPDCENKEILKELVDYMIERKK